MKGYSDNMTLQPLGMKNLLPFLKLYHSAFPKYERKPLAMLLRTRRRGLADLYTLRGDDGSFAGLLCTIRMDNTVLLDYLAVSPERRGNGVGSSAVRLILEQYAGNRIVLEIEDPDEDCADRETRVRRLRFYERNGFQRQGVRAEVGGVRYELLVSGSAVSFEEYTGILSAVMGPFFPMLHVRLSGEES